MNRRILELAQVHGDLAYNQAVEVMKKGIDPNDRAKVSKLPAARKRLFAFYELSEEVNKIKDWAMKIKIKINERNNLSFPCLMLSKDEIYYVTAYTFDEFRVVNLKTGYIFTQFNLDLFEKLEGEVTLSND